MGELGSSDGLDNKWKVYFFVYVISILVVLLLASIGASGKSFPIIDIITLKFEASESSKSLIYFYVFFGLVGFIVPFIWDQLSMTSNHMDTVTVEEGPVGLFGQVIVGILIAGWTFWRAVNTQKAWVNAPKFGIFQSKIGEAVLSGMGGVIENWFYFAFLFPTVYTNLDEKIGKIPAFLSASICISTIFMFSHKLWIYKYNEVALFATFIFSMINCAFTYFFRSMIVSDFLHASNNISVGMDIAMKTGFAVAF